jgi:RHS repeat-associated protein
MLSIPHGRDALRTRSRISIPNGAAALLALVIALPAFAHVPRAHELATARVIDAAPISVTPITLYDGATEFHVFTHSGKLASGVRASLGENNVRGVNELRPEAWQVVDNMHARYYNPNVGRFLSVDPVLDVKRTLPNPQMWNRYAYVRNTPINVTDPDGRLCEPCYENQLKNEQLAVINGQMTMDQYLDIQRTRFNIAMSGMSLLGVGEAVSSIRGLFTLARAGFSAGERGVISTTAAILKTGGKELVAAFESGEAKELTIAGQRIIVQPDAPMSGMTLQGEKAFVLGKEAFSSSGELAKTILHEMYRLTFQGGTQASGASAAEATEAAATFADKAFDVITRLVF